VADYDSAGNVGGTLALLSMSFPDNYATLEALAGGADFPKKTVGGYEYQAHVQDVIDVDSRIFVLAIYSAVTDPAPVPPEYQYIKSEVREYKLVLSSSGEATFQLVATQEISKNAVHLAHHVVGGTGYLFVPCIGGYQNAGSGNGPDSSLSLVKLTPTGFDPNAGFEQNGEMRALVGVTASVAYFDFRSIAIASDGTVYFLCANLTSSKNGMTFTVFTTTASHLVSNGASGNTSYNPPVPYTIPTDFGLPARPYIQTQTATSAFFWALGISVGDNGNEYLIFAKGGVNNPSSIVAHDVISYVPVGQPWVSTYVHTLGNPNSSSPNDFTGLSNSVGFYINSVDICVPGGDIKRLRTAAPQAGVGRLGGVRGGATDELREESKKALTDGKK
jgi:hypothetical protein